MARFRTVRSVPPSTCPSDPPRIPAPPTSPQTRLKKTVQASVSQSTTNHSPRAKKLQTPVQPRIRTTPPPPSHGGLFDQGIPEEVFGGLVCVAVGWRSFGLS